MTRITLIIDHDDRKDTYQATSKSENFPVLGPLGRVLNAAIANHKSEIEGLHQAINIVKAWMAATNQPVDAMNTSGQFGTYKEAGQYLGHMLNEVRPASGQPATTGTRGPGTNTGHGWAWPRPDGFQSDCGGPGVCSFCAADLQEYGGGR